MAVMGGILPHMAECVLSVPNLAFLCYNVPYLELWLERGEVMEGFIKSELEGKKLGANIQIARKRRKLSLAALSAKSSVSITVLRRIEAGDVSVGFGKVFNVLDALGLLTGISDIASPDLDRQQALSEIKALREGKTKRNNKSNLVRFG